jgi:hypothetical protein
MLSNSSLMVTSDCVPFLIRMVIIHSRGFPAVEYVGVHLHLFMVFSRMNGMKALFHNLYLDTGSGKMPHHMSLFCMSLQLVYRPQMKRLSHEQLMTY